MSKQIVLNSFSAVSFDVTVRQSPVWAMICPTFPRDGDLPVEAQTPANSLKAEFVNPMECPFGKLRPNPAQGEQTWRNGVGRIRGQAG